MDNLDETIAAALALLDPKDDNSWTNDGLPAVAKVQELASLDKVTRADIQRVAPKFTRENPVIENPVEPASDEPAEVSYEEQLRAAEAEVEALNDKLNEATKLRDDSQIAFEKAAKAYDVALNNLAKLRGSPQNFVTENQRYLQKQQELRMSGEQAPIDQALTGRRRYVRR